MSAGLTDQAAFRELAAFALECASAEHVFVSFSDRAGGTTRFANNQIIQNVNTRRRQLSVSVAFGQQHGSASTTDLSEESVRRTVSRAEQIARLAPPDPEYIPPLGPQTYPVLPTLRADTLAVGPARRAAEVAEVVKLCRSEQLVGAGIVSAYVTSVGLAASTGLGAFEQRSEAQFSLTASGPDSSGWVSNSHRSFEDLRIPELAQVAISKAQRSMNPRELPPGRYSAILEPAAVAGLLGPLIGALDAKSYFKGTSALAGRLGQPIIDSRLTLQNRPDHPALLGSGFDGNGVPSDSRTWIDRGVLASLDFDRFTAQEHGRPPSFSPDAPHLSGAGPRGEGVEALIEHTQRGILVTNFWYIRGVNPTDLTLTGMTRDGTFLVEDGQIVCGLIDFRWHDSPLRALNAVEVFSAPCEAFTLERGKMLLPAMRIADFNFSSVTRF
jgi:predicted Zn-dependent protease